MEAIEIADVLRAYLRDEPHPKQDTLRKQMRSATILASYGDGWGGDVGTISIALPYGETITIRVTK